MEGTDEDQVGNRSGLRQGKPDHGINQQAADQKTFPAVVRETADNGLKDAAGNGESGDM